MQINLAKITQKASYLREKNILSTLTKSISGSQS